MGQAKPGRWKITTKSGSIYYVRRDKNNRWWLSADNVENARSRKFPPGKEFEICQPPVLEFPPKPGEKLCVWTAQKYPEIMRDDLLVTSRVVTCEEL